MKKIVNLGKYKIESDGYDFIPKKVLKVSDELADKLMATFINPNGNFYFEIAKDEIIGKPLYDKVPSAEDEQIDESININEMLEKPKSKGRGRPKKEK